MSAERSGLQEGRLQCSEQPRCSDPGLCIWDSSDTLRAVTERALFVGMISTVHASVIVQVFLGFCFYSVSMQFKCGGPG